MSAGQRRQSRWFDIFQGEYRAETPPDPGSVSGDFQRYPGSNYAGPPPSELARRLRDTQDQLAIGQEELCRRLGKELGESISRGRLVGWLNGGAPRGLGEDEVFQAIDRIREQAESRYESRWVPAETVSKKLQAWLDKYDGLTVGMIREAGGVSKTVIWDWYRGGTKVHRPRWQAFVSKVEEWLSRLEARGHITSKDSKGTNNE